MHHPTLLADGPPEDIAVWFIVDGDDEVIHTGVARGPEDEVIQRVRTAHPAHVSDFSFAFEKSLPGRNALRVLWLPPASAIPPSEPGDAGPPERRRAP